MADTLEVNAMTEPMPAPASPGPTPELLAPDFSAAEIARLERLRARYRRGEFDERTQEHKRLLFVRWLVEHDRISG